jgi:hypothetical protein
MGFGLVSLPITLTLVGSLRFSFQQFFATWQFKRSPVLLIQRILLKKISQRHFKDWLGIAIFRQQVTAGCKNMAGFLCFPNFFSDL